MRVMTKIEGRLIELYEFRYMLHSLIRKSLFGKYKNSVLGFLWNFITPLISVLLFYIVFENFSGQSVPYFWAYLCVGMFPVNYMTSNMIGGASCITSNGALIKKMYFPSEMLPLSQASYTLIVFIIAYLIVIALMVITGFPLKISGLLAFPFIISMMFVFSLGTILFTSAISAYSRDFEYLITALARILFWVTPIVYTIDSISGILSTIIWLNPMTYYVVSFQEILYKGVMPSAGIMASCAVLAIGALIIGTYVFNKLKDGFAERI